MISVLYDIYFALCKIIQKLCKNDAKKYTFYTIKNLYEYNTKIIPKKYKKIEKFFFILIIINSKFCF